MRTIHLPIAEPCHEDWNAMHPVAGGRHCDRCEKQVWDLSAMTEVEARALLVARAGERICVRYGHDGDRVRFRAASTAGVGAGAALAMALAACTPHAPQIDTPAVAEEPVPCASEVATIPGQPRVAPEVRPMVEAKVTVGRLPVRHRVVPPPKAEPIEPVAEFQGEMWVPDEF